MENTTLSLKDLAKRRLIDDMLEIVKVKMAQSEDIEKGAGDYEGAGGTGGTISQKAYIALIVDTHTLRIVSGACRQYDILERGVTVVEQIEKSRQPLSDLDAVYFVSPTDQSVEMLLKDHKSQSALYRYSHVFFSGPLSEKLFDTLAKEESFVNKCYSLFELNVDYVSFEPRVFHCDHPLTIRFLRGGNTDMNMMTSIIRRHVDCLVSVSASLREKPVIRYMARSTVSNLSEKIALGFKREIDSLAGAMDRLHKPFKNKGTTFIIVDRSIESSGLLIHEFSYQALALDVLEGAKGDSGVKWPLGLDTGRIGDDDGMSVLPSFTYKSVTGKGDEEVKHSVLADHDDLWIKYRHAHVKDVSEATTKELREFSKSHNLAIIQKGEAGRRNSDADPMELLRGLPEYQEILAKYSLHIELSKECFDVIERQKLMEIGRVEQELATGVDDDGKDVSCIKVFQALTSLLQSGRIGPEEKLRLVCLYLSQVNDVTESSAQTLVRTAAALSVENESMVKQFLSLGIHGTRAANGLGADPKGAPQSRHSHKLANDKNAIKKNKARAKASTYVNCRFVPKLKELVESCLTNSVDAAEFPLIGNTNASASVYSVGTENSSPTAGSNRSAASMWGIGKAAADGQLAAQEEDASPTDANRRQKIVVFVIGGITLAESRAMAELEQLYNCDVVVGGSCLLTPKRVFEILAAPTPIL